MVTVCDRSANGLNFCNCPTAIFPHLPNASSDNRPVLLATGGGAATSGGVLFEQQLGALIGVWMLAGLPLDSRLNLGTAQPLWFRFETEAPVDDILIATSDGGFVAIQAKTSISSSSDPQSPYGKTVEQFVRHWLACRDGDGRLEWNRPLDPRIDRLALVVSSRASASVRVDLLAALRARGEPGLAQLSQAQARAFADFEACVRQVWPRLTSEPFAEGVLDDLARLVTVMTFDPEGSNLAAILLTTAPNVADATAAINILGQYSGELMARRGGADVADLRHALVTRGARLQAQPRYRKDIAALQVHTNQVGAALKRYEEIETGPGDRVGIERDCQSAVEVAARTGSLLIVGEPGAGKSGVLNALARTLKDEGQDVLELAVDRYSVETLEGLAAELRLDNALLDVLEAWDGPGPAWLIIDALDATRGGKGEGVFRTLIEQVLTRESRWRVVASIRTFDLRMGQQFRALFKGQPPKPELADPGFSAVRHIRVPPWAPAELDRLLAQAPSLAAFLAQGSPRLQELATVPFNTRLLGELVVDGAVTSDLSEVATQAELLGLYWSHRIGRHGLAAETCLRRIVDAMIKARTLRAPRLDAAEDDPEMVQALSHEGVLISVDADRWIQFRHHLLFDYAASKVYLDPTNLLAGEPLFPKAEALGLMLAPALTFVLRELWSSEKDHDRFWTAVATLLADETGDPVIRSVASRIPADLAADAVDAERLAMRVIQGDEAAMAALSHIVGALAVRLEDETNVPLAAWVKLARILASNVVRATWPLRILGLLLIDRVTALEQRADLGVAVRALLEHAFTLPDPGAVVSAAIGLVADTYGTDPGSSRALLRQVFDDDRFAAWGWDEVPALARKIEAIAEADPDFAADIYRETYSRDVREHRETLMGASQILSLRSNARQDYDMARYSLSVYFPKYLVLHPLAATRAFIGAVDGFVARAHPLSKDAGIHRLEVAGLAVRMCEDHSYIWAYDPDSTYGHDGEVLISHFLARLRTAPEPEALRLAEALIGSGTLAVYWSRLFMAGAERGDALADLLWPFASLEPFLVALDTRKDAIDILVASLTRRSEAERLALEESVLNFDFSAFASPKEAKEGLLCRLFGAIGKSQLLTAAARDLIPTEVDEEVTRNKRLFNIQSSSRALSPYHWLEGLNATAPQNASLIAAIDLAKDVLSLDGTDANQGSLTFPAAMTSLRALAVALDSSPDAHEGLREYAEGVLGEGAGKILDAKLLPPRTDPDPADELLAFIEVAARSESPHVEEETEERFTESASWGSPAPRVEAAEAVLDLILQRPGFYERLAPLVDHLLADPHPAVRLQACLRLIRIWDIDREGFWAHVRRRLEQEQNTGVLDHFASRVLGWVVHQDPDRVEVLILNLFKRFGGAEGRAESIREHLSDLVAVLWVTHQRAGAYAVLAGWISNVAANGAEIRQVLVTLREAVVFGLRGEDDGDPALRARAQQIFRDCVEQANRGLAAHFDLANPDQAQMQAARQCAELVDVACLELYFASGTAGSRGKEQTAFEVDDLRQFFNEIQPILKLIGDYGTPHTIYYLLQLLEQLVDYDPAPVFDLAAHALLNGGRRTGYQYESMGADLLVRMVGIFLADHKEIFEENTRRQTLIECLETFLKAGWPAARRLLYRLPDLIQ